jgi:hypothetical protein
MSQPPPPAPPQPGQPILIDYRSRPPTKPSDPGYWSRFWVGAFIGPSVIFILLAGWGLAVVKTNDHYLDNPPPRLINLIHMAGIVCIFGVVAWLIWLLHRPVLRPWIWGSLVGILMPIAYVVIAMIRQLF